MSFALFLAYVVLSFVRPVELFAPALGEYRPMLVLWAVAFVAGGLRLLRTRELALAPAHVGLLAAFCAAVAASQLAAGWAGGAVDSLEKISPSIMLFVLVALNVTSLPRLRATCIAFVASMLVVAGLAVLDYRSSAFDNALVLRQNAYADEWEIDAGAAAIDAESDRVAPARDESGNYLWRLRGLGFLNDPNDLAQMLVVALPLLLLGWRRRRWLGNLVRVILPGTLVLYATALTHSRGALIGIGTMVLLALTRRLSAAKVGLLGALLVVALVGASAIGGRAFSTQERSAGERIESWYVGLQLLQQHPLLGVGHDNFTDNHYLTAHNSFVLCFAELGLLGYFAWLGLIVLAYRGLSAALATHAPEQAGHQLVLMLRIALAGFLACAWFLSRTYTPSLYFLLALCVAAWWVARHGRAEGALPVAWVRPTLWAMAASIATVYLFVLVERHA